MLQHRLIGVAPHQIGEEYGIERLEEFVQLLEATDQALNG